MNEREEEHRDKVHEDIFFSLLVMAGLKEDEAKNVVNAIIRGLIEHIKIEY